MNQSKTFSLIGAGAIGVAAITLGTAGIAGAQDGDDPTLADPATEEATEDSGREGRKARRQARVESTVQDLIAEGVITQEQVDSAESLREVLQAQREEAKAAKAQALADVLGLSVEDLRTAKQDGTSLVELAGDDLNAVVELFTEQATARINSAVESGRITQEQADERLDGIEDRIETRLEDGGGFGKRGHRGDRGVDRAADADAEETVFSA